MRAWVLDESLDALVVALCGDYERRARLIEEGYISRRTETEFRYYNFKIYDAASEICGERYAESFIKEIGGRIGYAKSENDHLSEPTYKQYKQMIKHSIAKRLHLTD